MQSLVYQRKPIVVTTDYIGPDRHRTPTRPAETVLIDVPNPLRTRVTGEEEPVAAQARIDEVVAEINTQKLERYTVDIGSLVNIALPKLEEGTIDPGARDILERLHSVARRAARRMADTERAHVSDLCNSLCQVAENLLAAEGAVNTKDVKLLKPLSQAVQAGFEVSEVTASAARAISITIGVHSDLDEIRRDLRVEAEKRDVREGLGSRRNRFILRLLSRECPTCSTAAAAGADRFVVTSLTASIATSFSCWAESCTTN